MKKSPWDVAAFAPFAALVSFLPLLLLLPVASLLRWADPGGRLAGCWFWGIVHYFYFPAAYVCARLTGRGPFALPGWWRVVPMACQSLALAAAATAVYAVARRVRTVVEILRE